jgi:hypothetical protein
VDSSQTAEVLTGEVVDVDADAPARGTLAWLELQEHEDVNGRELPVCHRIPDGAVWRSDAERGSRCALVKPGGVACGAPATRRYGVCMVHAGGGSQDMAELSRKGAAKLARLRVQRELLGVGPRGMANPRAVARVAAAERAQEIAEALLAPLDARGLPAMDRQRAAAVILGETFPAATATLEVELPASPEAVAELGWADLQALAARVLEPAPNQ